MTSFWAQALVMAVVAALFVLWPLVRKTSANQDAVNRDEMVLDLFNEHLVALQKQHQQGDVDDLQFEQLKSELEMSLLEDSSVAVNAGTAQVTRLRLILFCCSLSLILVSVWFYSERGAIPDVEIQQLLQDKDMADLGAIQQGQEPDSKLAEELLSKLQSRVEQHPDNEANRYLLARLAAEQGRYLLSLKHYSQLIEANPEAANILAETAQVVFLASENRITPEVDSLVGRALQINPQEPTALGLAGISAFSTQDFAGAINAWEMAGAHLPPQARNAQILKGGIARARQLMNDRRVVDGGEIAASDAPQISTAVAVASIDLVVTQGNDVEITTGAVVFIYARAWQGPKMPLAITRIPATNLPAKVSLTEAMAMSPAMTISSVPQLELVARISQSGTPEPQAGDWQGSFGPVVLADISGPITLMIDQKIP